MKRIKNSLPLRQKGGKFRHLFGAIFVALSLILSANFCVQSEQSQNIPELGPGQNRGSVTLLLTDFPIANRDVTAVYVNFRSIEVNSENDGWLKVIDYGPGGKIFDLLKLQNGVTSPLGSFSLSPGQYNQIRLILNDANLVEVHSDGITTMEPLSTPSATRTGVKLVHPFVVDTNGYTVLTLDFNAEESVSYNRGTGFILKPVIKVIDSQTTSGAISTIGVDGGIAGIIGELELDFPAGSLNQDTSIEIFPLDPNTLTPQFSSLQWVSNPYNVMPRDIALNSDVSIKFNYTQQQLKALGIDETTLQICYYDIDSKTWTPIGGEIDPELKTVTVSVNKLGAYGLVGEGAGPSIEPAAVRGGGYNHITKQSLIEIPEVVAATITPRTGSVVQSAQLHFYKEGETSAPTLSTMVFNASTGQYESLLDATLFYGEVEPSSIRVYIEAFGSDGEINLAPGATDDTIFSTWFTYSYHPDLDADEMNDRWELDFGLNPKSNDSTSDLDADGLSNLAEYQTGSQPHIFDATIGGSITGLSDGETVVLSNNDESLTITATDSEVIYYQFSSRVSDGGAYEITVTEQPASGKTCTVTDGSGAIAGNHIVNANIQCQGQQEGFIAISSGHMHKLAIRADGTLWAWGQNYYRQLGDGTTTNRTKPVQIGSDSDWKEVHAGYYHSMALKTDGTLWGWGDGSYGRIGTNGNTRTPIQVGSDSWKSLCVGVEHSIGVKSDGTLWGWGYNYNGQVGDGSGFYRTTPVEIGSGYKSVHCGPYHNLAIKNDGSLWGWGQNHKGQLGDGTTLQRYRPVLVSSESWQSAAAGRFFSVAIKSDGTLWGAGQNFAGFGFADTSTIRTELEQIGSETWRSVSSHLGYNLLAIHSNGSLWGAGSNYYGQLGTGDTGKYTVLTQVSSAAWSTVSIGGFGSAGIQSDGTLWTWGHGSFGEIGDGNQSHSFEMVNIQIAPPPEGQSGVPTVISTGYAFSAAVKGDGTLWTWGSNSYGQLGNGGSNNVSAPEQLGTDSDWKLVSAGSNHVLALKNDGTLWAWGYNYYGQLGIGNKNNRNTPVQVGSATNWVAIAAGGSHSLAINDQGFMYAWGGGRYGQLGLGSTTDRTTPVKVYGSGWESVSAGGNHSVAIKSDGTMYGWGLNNIGQAGSGATWKNETSPTRIGSYYVRFSSVEAGSSHTLAIDTSKNIWSWGYNQHGELGVNSTRHKYTPTKISYHTDFASVSAGMFHSFGIKEDGTLWAWGYDNYAQRGVGYWTIQKYPYKDTSRNWSMISAGGYHSIGLSDDGILYGWGYGTSGQTGIGSFPYKVYSPSEITFQ